MQSLIENLMLAFAVMTVIIVMLTLFGVIIEFRDEIRRRKIDIYARVIVTPLLLFVALYLYLQGALSPDILFMGIVWLIPVILCTDWTQLRRTKSEQEKT